MLDPVPNAPLPRIEISYYYVSFLQNRPPPLLRPNSAGKFSKPMPDLIGEGYYAVKIDDGMCNT